MLGSKINVESDRKYDKDQFAVELVLLLATGYTRAAFLSFFEKLGQVPQW